MPRLSPEAQKKRNEKFAETMRRKKQGAAAKAVVPLHDLVPRTTASRTQATTNGVRKALRSGQPPITVQFGKIKITIEMEDL